MRMESDFGPSEITFQLTGTLIKCPFVVALAFSVEERNPFFKDKILKTL